MDKHGFCDSAVQKELMENGVYMSVTKGSSMRPLFRTNRDVVFLKRCDTEPRKYDVVLYRDCTGKYILHRIVRVYDDAFIIRGDNTFVNERVSKSGIIAVLTEFNRKGKKYTVESAGYRIYSRLWNFIYPVRYLFHQTLRLLRTVYRKIFKRK